MFDRAYALADKLLARLDRIIKLLEQLEERAKERDHVVR